MKQSKQNSDTRKWLKYFTITLFLFTLFFTGLQAAFSGISKAPVFSPGEADEEFKLVSIVDSDNPFFDTFKDSKRINVLLIGLTHENLTDTLMLGSFDTDTQQADLISIPRDTYYPREGYTKAGQSKINAAYLGEPVNTAVAVSDTLQGMPIHYYALTTYDSIEKIVDAMGGVPVNVPFHMRYDDNTKGQELHINIPAGEQVLTGEKAVEYLRFRKANPGSGYKSYTLADIDRAKAQQEFLKSAFQQSIGHLPSVATSVRENVESNIDLKTALQIAAEAVGMSQEDIHSHSLPGEARTGEDGLDYFFADEDAIQDLITQIYLPPAATDSAMTSGEAVQ